MAVKTLPEIFQEHRSLALSYESMSVHLKQVSASTAPDLMGHVAGQSGFGLSASRSTEDIQDFYGEFRNWVYICINAIAKRIGSQPWMAGEIPGAIANPDRSFARREKVARIRERLPSSVYQKAVVDAELDVLKHHAVIDLLCRPNAIQRKFEFLFISAANLLITGVNYWMGGISEETGEPELWALPSHWVTPVHKPRLFDSYILKFPWSHEEIPVAAENISRTYIPSPADLRGVTSPLIACMTAIRIDRYIQGSQLQTFQRGIFPNLIVGVGRLRGKDGKATDRRPVLSGAQRRTLLRSIREVWDQSVNQGDPAIIDGMIESIHKLTNTPMEMDWPASGELVKRRIFQCFGVNPISVGEITGANRAQALEAERHLADNAANPLVDAFSEAATDFLGPWYEKPKRLVIWLERVVPKDEEFTLRSWSTARQNGDVTPDEFRSEILGLAPLEEVEEEKRAPILDTVGALQGAVTVLTAVGQGVVQRDSAKALFMLSFQISEEQAEALVGEEQPDVVEPPPPPPQEPTGDEEADDEEDELDDDQIPDESDSEDSGGSVSFLPQVKGFRQWVRMARTEPLNKASVSRLHLKQHAEASRDMTQSLAPYFLREVRKFVRQMKDADWTPVPENASGQASKLVRELFDLKNSSDELFQAATAPSLRAFIDGAQSEVDLLEIVLPSDTKRNPPSGTKQQHMSDDLERLLGIETQLPEWLKTAAIDALEDAFREDYWQKIPASTRDDIQKTLETSIRDGHSINRIAKEIMERHGEEYSRWRAVNVARTEMTGFMNAGHVAGMKQVAQETGIEFGKEWLSVLGSTTRRDHADADGQQVGPDEDFKVGGESAAYPGDRKLSAKNRCHCQCTVISAPVASAIEDAFKDDPSESSEAVVGELSLKERLATDKKLEEKRFAVIKAMASIGTADDNRIDSEVQQIEGTIAEASSRIQAAMDRLSRTGTASSQDDQLMDELWKEIRKLQGKRGKLLEKREQARQRKRVDAITKVLKSDSPTPLKTIESPGTTEKDGRRRVSNGKYSRAYRAKMTEARKFLANITDSKIEGGPTKARELLQVNVHSGGKGLRAFYRPGEGSRSGVYVQEGNSVAIFIHELGHHLEHKLPGALKRAREFRQYRWDISGTTEQSLRAQFGKGYGREEVANEDEFWKAVTKDWKPGDPKPAKRSSSGYYVGKNYDGLGTQSTEILSMGVQLLYEDPGGFAQRDPEYFKFVVGVLDGSIR